MKFRILIVLISIAFSTKAQHAYFSSLNQNLLSVNPAFAGTNGKLRAQVITGNTGTSKYGSYRQSYYGGIDFLVKRRSGFGVSFSSGIYANSLNNTNVVLRESQMDFSYGLHLKLNDNIKIVPAIQISYFQITLNRTYLPTGYYYEERGGPFVPHWGDSPIIVTKRNLDFSSGLIMYGKRFYAGISILSITQPDEGLLGVSKRPLTQIYQAKYRFLDPEKFNFDMYGFVKVQKYKKYIRAENFVQYGTYLNYKILSLHLAQRLNEVSAYDEFIVGVALNIKGFRVGYNNKCNYGNNVSTYFFNELFLQYSFGRNKKDNEGTADKGIKLID